MKYRIVEIEEKVSNDYSEIYYVIEYSKRRKYFIFGKNVWKRLTKIDFTKPPVCTTRKERTFVSFKAARNFLLKEKKVKIHQEKIVWQSISK